MPDKRFPWLNCYPKKVDWAFEIQAKPVFFLLQNTAEHFPNHPAFDFLGKKYTWRKIYDLARRLAHGLQAQGIGKGHKVGLFLPNCPYYIISYYGVLMTGACVVNFNPLYAEGELVRLIKDSGVETIITADLAVLSVKVEKLVEGGLLKRIIVGTFTDVLPFPKNILFQVFKNKDIARLGNQSLVITWDDLLRNEGRPQIPSIDPREDVAVLQYTGGTTGTPKGAMLTHENVYANTMQVRAWLFNTKEGNGIKMMGVLPFFHVFAMTAVMNTAVALAMEIIAMPRFELKETLKLIHKKKPHFFPAVPAIYSAINASPLRKKYDLHSLEYCISGGAPLPVEVKQKFEAETECVVFEGYGLTESSPVATVNPIEGVNKPGSIGLPLPQTIIEIVNLADKKTVLPIGERGEICIRGPQVMKGYWNQKEATDEVLRPTGEGDMRLHTGDIGIMDSDGYVFIVDRIKDMIITNGYNVYPRNVEEAIYLNPAVEECIVAGLPDEQRGEIVKAWIKLKSGQTLTGDQLKDFLKDKISPMEIPKRIEFRDQPLPKTLIGKLSRKDVVAQEPEKPRT